MLTAPRLMPRPETISSAVELSFRESSQPYTRAVAGGTPQNGPMLPHSRTKSSRTASVSVMSGIIALT